MTFSSHKLYYHPGLATHTVYMFYFEGNATFQHVSRTEKLKSSLMEFYEKKEEI